MLGVIIAGAFAPCLRTVASNSRLLSRANEATLQELTLEQLLRLLSADQDSHRLSIPPVVHPRGRIRFPDGTLHPISSRTGPERPDGTSSAVTSMRVVMPAALQVSSIGIESARLRVRGCAARFPIDGAGARAFIGLSLESFWYFVPSGEPEVHGRCVVLHLSPRTSLLFENPDDGTELSIRLLLPVERFSTLYLDTRGVLRRLNHLAERLHHQPILENLSRFVLQTRSDPGTGIMIFRLSAKLVSGRRSVLEATNRLGRLPAHTLLMNWPNISSVREELP